MVTNTKYLNTTTSTDYDTELKRLHVNIFKFYIKENITDAVCEKSMKDLIDRLNINFGCVNTMIKDKLKSPVTTSAFLPLHQLATLPVAVSALVTATSASALRSTLRQSVAAKPSW